MLRRNKRGQETFERKVAKRKSSLVLRYEIKHNEAVRDLFDRSNVIVFDKNRIIERFGHFSGGGGEGQNSAKCVE